MIKRYTIKMVGMHEPDRMGYMIWNVLEEKENKNGKWVKAREAIKVIEDLQCKLADMTEAYNAAIGNKTENGTL